MVSGVEYRTTERRRGKAVYTKIVDFGTLPANTTTYIYVGVAGSQIRSVKGSAYSNTTGEYQPFPIGMNGVVAAYAWIDNAGNLYVRTMENLSEYHGVFELWYTKD